MTDLQKQALQSCDELIKAYEEKLQALKDHYKGLQQLFDHRCADLKEWYIIAYPEDELGSSLNEDLTFEGAYFNSKRIYAYLGVGDSIVRERVFEETAKRFKVDYSVLYNNWLNK